MGLTQRQGRFLTCQSIRGAKVDSIENTARFPGPVVFFCPPSVFFIPRHSRNGQPHGAYCNPYCLYSINLGSLQILPLGVYGLHTSMTYYLAKAERDSPLGAGKTHVP